VQKLTIVTEVAVLMPSDSVLREEYSELRPEAVDSQKKPFAKE
jgi:hypothetical protein